MPRNLDRITFRFNEPISLYNGMITMTSLGPIAKGGAVAGAECFSVDVSSLSVNVVESLGCVEVEVIIPSTADIFGDTNYTVTFEVDAARDKGIVPNAFPGLSNGQYWFITQHTTAPIITGTTPTQNQMVLSSLMPQLIYTFDSGVQFGAGRLTISTNN